MKRLLAVLAGLLVTLMIASPALAKNEVEISDAVREEGRLRLTVSTPGGPLLSAGDFEVTVNGSKATDIVASARSTYNTRPAVALVVDTSGSMSGEPITDAKKAIATFMGRIDPRTRVSLIPFSSRVARPSPFSDRHERLLERTAHLEADGETALNDAIVTAVNVVKGRPPEQRNIIVLTDGADTVSEARLGDALKAVSEAGATVFAVGLKSPDYQAQPIRVLANESGGQLLQTADSSELSSLFNDLAKTLVSGYTISVTNPDPRAELLEVKVAVHMEPTDVSGKREFRLPLPKSSQPAPLQSVQSIPLPLLLLIVFGSTAGIALLVLERIRAKKSSVASRIAWYVDEHGEDHVDPDALISVAILQRAQDVAVRLAGKTGFFKRLENDLEAAAMRWRPAEVLVASVLLALAAGILGFAVGGFGLGLLGFIAGGISLIAYLRVKASRRRKAFADQLPDVLVLLGGALKAGYSLQQAIGAVGEDARPPASEEFRRTMAEVRLGNSLDGSLNALAERVALIDFEWTILAMQIQREVGGNLAQILETIADTIRDRGRLRRHIRALTAEGRLSAMILGALPFAMAGFLLKTNPTYLEPLYTTSLGIAMILGSSVLMGLGFLWMRKIIKIEV